ncbi:chromosome transmission fidelity protein 8 homolog [Strongylocentrotus purpuratus]|uniref:Chromosome transmission fidelity protein 8 homolog n=1 Tax=Strongylocentrotus purpuratus TaxID=7668 RepID=A0A7M7G1H6_STRPU|nr:chromosome transmission fidelity protein 8 homolog [Strongylocentrotus purpuratus]|eukprot:XP_001199744.2 PREDICTED: chromosome transmission fidelity protein 8 homolog [Strongylocentrotus purpuratus]
MVQLYVKSPTAPGATPEWMLIELQGAIESPDNEQLTGRFIGDLHFNLKGVPVLIIGHHILYGKVTDLEKPFIVLMKNENAAKVIDGDHASDAMDVDSSQDGNGRDNTLSQQDDTYYYVNAVIKKKMIFKARPKPIITNVPKKV